MADLKSENKNFNKAINQNLLSLEADSGIDDDDYLKFLKTRSVLILNEIKRRCGEITTPRKDERKEVVENLEIEIRNYIHRTLSENGGRKYWKSHIPPHLQDRIKERIKQFIDKNPDSSKEDQNDPRWKLDFCTVKEYQTIIESGINWKNFEATFRKLGAFQTYCDNFNEYRNAVMHNREVSELLEKNGEAAMIWFNEVLPDYEETEIPD
jgi:hypothetical protein